MESGTDNFAILEIYPSYSKPHGWWVCSHFSGSETCFQSPIICTTARHVKQGCGVLGFSIGGEMGISITPCEQMRRLPRDMPKRPPRSQTHDVYFIQPKQGGPIKIGMSNDVQRRLDLFEPMNPYPLKCLGVIRTGGARLEKSLHNQFQNSRLHGEWFGPTDDLLEYIESNTEALS